MFSFTIRRTADEMDRRVIEFTQDGTTLEIVLDEPAPEDPQEAFQLCMQRMVADGLVPDTPFALRN